MDLRIAETCASLHAVRTRPYRNSLLAATATIPGLTILTRNTGDFSDAGLSVVNAWSHEF